MSKSNFDKYIENIRKTGFDLEFRTSQSLRAQGWSVINNKYYIDDQQPTVREIDLVAYKVRQIRHFLVYTTLIISCKKSDQNLWAMLSKEIDLKDPNIDWRPLHIWSNDNVIDYMITQPDFKDRYFRAVSNDGTTSAMRAPDYHVFAFQEMNIESGKPQNDRPIFESITSLMKAQAYELDALPQRKKNPTVYQFNLISVVDTQLIRMHFAPKGIKAISLDDVDYVANYIVRKKETFARVHFVHYEFLTNIIQDYNRLHENNCTVFDALCDWYYKDAVQDDNKRRLFLDEFLKYLKWYLHWWFQNKFNKSQAIEGIELCWKGVPGILSIQIDANEAEVFALNDDEDIKKKTRFILKKFYKYEGPFEFAVVDVPF